MRKIARKGLLGPLAMAIGLVLIIIGLVTPQIGSGGVRGMGSTNVSYDLANVALIAVGVGLSVIGGWLLISEKKDSDLIIQVPSTEKRKERSETLPKNESGGAEKEIEESDYLVLRLLNGDEREMYRMIVDNGGSALQKDLIMNLKWSDAKVSRTIDKLIDKRVVSKERYGSTNRVKIDLTYKRD
jgi:hypothetical protein